MLETLLRRQFLRAVLSAAAAALAPRASAQTPPSASAERPPVATVDGVATVTLEDAPRDPGTGLRHVRLAPPPPPSRRALLAVKPDKSATGRAIALMRARGAAGNRGDFYDNRDRGHSTFKRERTPALTAIAYDATMRGARLDYGLNNGLIFDAIVVGNSSTALTTGPNARSLPRWAMTAPGAMRAQAALYSANHLYVYPEHRDHDTDLGDRFPAASPHFVISQGSSGSDWKFLRALFEALAAMRPETKEFLRAQGLVAPTLQMLSRRSMAGIETDADYLDGRAHPSAFDGDRIRRGDLIRRANALPPEDVAPPPRLAMRSETLPASDVGLFGDGLTEQLFDTPDAIARVARGVAGSRFYRLRADFVGTGHLRDPKIEWRVLRGPGVSLSVRDDRGRVAEIEVPWTEPYEAPAAPGASPLRTHRIDVAAFVRSGEALSAPAMFSVVFPPRERRRYRPDGQPELIDYQPTDADALYSDPLLFPRRRWRDAYLYDPEGRLRGWTRTLRDGTVEQFTRHGLRVLESDDRGRPALARAVAYPMRQGGDGGRHVSPRQAGRVARYVYAGPDDLLGEAFDAPQKP